MNDLVNFKRWLGKALKTRLVFTIEDNNHIVTDGYTAYLLRDQKYFNELKMQTFQDLDKSFQIHHRIISFDTGGIRLLDIFKASKEANITPIYIDVLNNKTGKYLKARLFTVNDIQVFISEEYLNYINLSKYQAYGTDAITPIVFRNTDVDFATLPVRNASQGMKISILH